MLVQDIILKKEFELNYDPILIAVIAGFVGDILFGEPKLICHPVIVIGRMIRKAELFFRNRFPQGPTGERTAGALTWLWICLICTGIPLGLLFLAYRIHPILGLLLDAFFCFRLIAFRSMKLASLEVYDALCESDQTGDLSNAAVAVGKIVGRDTTRLDAKGIAKAAVESVAESTSDGIIAPLFYMFLFGAAGGFFYKCVNTMDSMLGYRNDRYMYFGTVAARADDILNFIPARLSALFMILATPFCKLDMKHAWHIFLRDHLAHKSPNSACPESAAAGALGIRLGGDAYYFGAIVHKPTIGDPIREISKEDILKVNRLMAISSILFCMAAVGIRLAFLLII